MKIQTNLLTFFFLYPRKIFSTPKHNRILQYPLTFSFRFPFSRVRSGFQFQTQHMRLNPKRRKYEKGDSDLRPRSTTRPSSTANSPGRPGSKEGSAMGENSVKTESEPSFGRSR